MNQKSEVGRGSALMPVPAGSSNHFTGKTKMMFIFTWGSRGDISSIPIFCWGSNWVVGFSMKVISIAITAIVRMPPKETVSCRSFLSRSCIRSKKQDFLLKPAAAM